MVSSRVEHRLVGYLCDDASVRLCWMGQGLVLLDSLGFCWTGSWVCRVGWERVVVVGVAWHAVGS
jgi:hypothetical protein